MPTWSRRQFLAGLASAMLPLPSRGDPRPVRFGITPVMLDDRAGFLNAWALWLGGQLGRPVTFVQRSRYREIVDLVLGGQLDLAWICGYPYVRHRDALTLIAVPRFQGQPLYHSYLIVAADSLAQSWEDLAGCLFAWADPDSNSGYLFPRYHLTRAGRDPDRFFRRSFFTWGHPRSIRAVADGLADAAAVDGYVWDTLSLREPSLAARTRVLLRSPPFGFPPLVASLALSEGDRQTLRRLLLSQVQDPVGRHLLAELNLDSFSIEGPALYDSIAGMATELSRSGRA